MTLQQACKPWNLQRQGTVFWSVPQGAPSAMLPELAACCVEVGFDGCLFLPSKVDWYLVRGAVNLSRVLWNYRSMQEQRL